jgi:hypothetical protein
VTYTKDGLLFLEPKDGRVFIKKRELANGEYFHAIGTGLKEGTQQIWVFKAEDFKELKN